MGRLNRRQAEGARAGEDSVPCVRAEKELRARGVLIPLSTIAGRSVAECIDAISWAHNRRPLSARPAWIGELLAEGKATEGPEPFGFVERVLSSLHTKGLGARVELVDAVCFYVFASHPYGPERSITIETISDAYAKTETGTIVNPSDVVDRLLSELRKRDPAT